MEKYPKSAKVVRNYARFLENVKNDPWTASRLLRYVGGGALQCGFGVSCTVSHAHYLRISLVCADRQFFHLKTVAVSILFVLAK